MQYHGNMFVFDGHNDALLSIHSPKRGKGRSFFEKSDIGHVDLPRAIEGGLLGGFFAMFVPTPSTSEGSKEAVTKTKDGYRMRMADPVEQGHAYKITNQMIDLFDELLTASEGKFRAIRGTEDLAPVGEGDVVHALLHIEGAEAIDEDLAALDHFYERGVRSIGPVWSRQNAFGTGVPFRFPGSPDIGPGLTDAGKRLVRACNERGIVVDLSHLNEQGFWDVARHTDRPLVVSHAAAHALIPFTRNLTDQQIDAVGESGGIIGMNFYVGGMREDGKNEPDTPIAELIRHITHMVDRIGINHVGLGSDFDGAVVPLEVSDASKLPNVVTALREAGYGKDDIAKLCHGNWLRVLKETL